jgi:hypothetical protein
MILIAKQESISLAERLLNMFWGRACTWSWWRWRVSLLKELKVDIVFWSVA